MTNQNIIFFAGIDWEGNNKMPCHHIVEELSKRNNVYYIDNFGGIRDPDLKDLKRALNLIKFQLRGNKNAKKSSHSKVQVLRPKIFPTPRLHTLQKLNAWILSRQLRGFISHYGIINPIVWTRLPIEVVWRCLPTIQPKLVVYQMIDKFPYHPKIAPSLHARFLKWESLFAEEADLVFTSAKGLYEEKIKQNENTYFFPNGVSPIFQKTVRPDQNAQRNKRIGFSGAIGTSLNFQWVSYAAEKLPNYEFCLVGPIDKQVNVENIKKHTNIILTGRLEHDQLPEIFSTFDAAFMAYNENYYQQFTYPAKLGEYLLSGLPVVSSWNPEIENFSEVIHLADTKEHFVNLLQAAVAERYDDEKESKRRERGLTLLWPNLVRQMESTIDLHLDSSKTPKNGR